MAFLDSGNYKEVPHAWIEERNNTIRGEQTRTRYRVLRFYTVSTPGIQSPAATTAVSGTTCTLTEHGADQGHKDVNSTYTAVYEGKTAWA